MCHPFWNPFIINLRPLSKLKEAAVTVSPHQHHSNGLVARWQPTQTSQVIHRQISQMMTEKPVKYVTLHMSVYEEFILNAY